MASLQLTRRAVLGAVTAVVLGALAIVVPGALSSDSPSGATTTSPAASESPQLSGLEAIKAPVPDDVSELLAGGGLSKQATTYQQRVGPSTRVFVATQFDRIFLVLYQDDSRRATMTYDSPQNIARRGLSLSTGAGGEAGGAYAALVPDEVGAVEVVDPGGSAISSASAEHNIVYVARPEPFTVRGKIGGSTIDASVGLTPVK